jgi:hypothetical protein
VGAGFRRGRESEGKFFSKLTSKKKRNTLLFLDLLTVIDEDLDMTLNAKLYLK